VVLLLKLLLAPALVAGSSLAGRRWGASVAGLLVALPIVAGPILLVTCLEQGTRFGARAASSSLLGLVSLALFAVVFSRAGGRLHWVAALAVSWLVTLGADLGLARITLPALAGLVVVLVAAEVAGRLLPRPGPAEERTTPWPWWDLPGRAVATAVLVLVVTDVAAAVGPGLTGVLAPFPIATSVVAAFVLASRGPGAVAETLRGTLRGLSGFAVFCFLVAVLVEHLGVAVSFGAALVGAVATTGVRLMAAVASRRARAESPGGPPPRAAAPSVSGAPERSSAAYPAAPAASPAAADD
jgi:hypothetical protein